MRHLRKGVRGRVVFGTPVLAVLLMGTIYYFPGGLNAQATAADIPDVSGVWDRRGLSRPDVPLPLTARAIGFSLAFDEQLSPRYDCSPAASPFLLRDPYNIAIEQQADRVLLLYEKDDVVRTVWLEGYGHPEAGPYDFTVQGHSMGRYEGNELVVETTKFTFDPIGLGNTASIPSSTMKKVTERYWREGNLLKAEVITEDPVVLREPYAFGFQWEQTEMDLVAYNCDPELARYPAQFQPSKYQEPGWVRLPTTTLEVDQ